MMVAVTFVLLSIAKAVTFLFSFLSFVFLTIFLLRRYVFSCRYLLRSIYGFVHPERFDLCEHAFPFFCDLWLFSSRKVCIFMWVSLAFDYFWMFLTSLWSRALSSSR
ncbi:hypothetical protein D0Y65_035656 [Glycine soja]|uniref:Uncharacterized protein n=1 Tax=Glycine soja TaxID=3848 RepID=A0A445HAV9_GLYSO|nr:hypothetical protein D0Y65_035656 [Glycine soja]